MNQIDLNKSAIGAKVIFYGILLACYYGTAAYGSENTAGYRYRGFLDVRVIEPNQAQYILGVKFSSPYSKTVDFIMRPYNGKANIETFQPLYQQNNGEDKRAFNITHKYYVSLRLREDNLDKFTGQVGLYKRKTQLNIDINSPYRFVQSDFKLITEQPVKGRFNEVNEYLFVDSAELKFYLKLNCDVIFSREEIIERFKQDKLLEQ